MNQSLLFARRATVLLILCAWFAKAAPAAPTIEPTSTQVGGLKIIASAVDSGVFHILAYPTDEQVPPASPFVVETLPLTSAKTTAKGSGSWAIETNGGTLSLAVDGSVGLIDARGRNLIPLGKITENSGTISFVMYHSTTDRLYGAGNASENVAGDLTHPSGNQIVSNGVTRIPFLWSTGGWSVLIANDVSGTNWNDLNGKLTWTVPSPFLDLYVTASDGGGYGLLHSYARLTGIAPLPPKWTFGFMVSRWGYSDAADVQDKWQQFRDRHIPIDAFIYDYDWFVNDWAFNPVTFPQGSIGKMKTMGLHFVGIRKPRVNGANLNFARQQGWVLNSPLGTDLRFDLPAARYWWWNNHAPLVKAGVDGWWNDEAEQTYDEFFWMNEAEWTGWRAMDKHRAWSISRAFSPGMQRFGAAVWTGDIDSSWSTLANQPGTLLNWALAGMPYTAQDIGGFQSTPTPELYARWIAEGVFVPVMRAHGTYNSPRWPWAFGDDALAAITKAIDERYRLIPYLYTIASETATTGAPLMRPLFLEFPNDQNTYNLESEWLVGDRLLAAPILSEGGSRDIYLPAGTWYDFNTGIAIESTGQTLYVTASLDTIPSYVRAGSIVTLGPVIQSTSLGQEDPLEIRVYPGEDAKFTLYEDDGDTYSYETGKYSTIPMKWDQNSKTFTVGDRRGSYNGMLALRHFDIVLPGGSVKHISYGGKTAKVVF
jgi:alpha-glucosidase